MTPKSSSIARLLGLLLVAVLIAAGCANDAEELGSESGGEAEQTDEPILIGGTLGLTGTYSASTEAYRVAYEYWVDKMNEEGGLLGREVELQIYDDESDPVVAQQLYEQLVNEDEADLLLAPYSTAVGGAIVPITERAGKILWDAGFVSAELHDTSEMLVTSWPYQEPEYPLPLFELFKTLPEDERPQTVAVATAQNPFTLVARDGYDGEGGVLNYAEELGMEVVFNEEYDQQATDFTGLVQQAKAADADVFIALSLPNDGALMARTMTQVDYSPDYYCQCGSQVVTLPTWPDLGDAGVNVFSTTTAWPGQEGRPNLDELHAHFQEQLGYTDMPAYGAGGLAIMQVMEQAIEATETLDQEELRAYLGENDFETAVGTLSYKDDGTTEFGAMLVQYQADGGQIVWPEEDATAEAVVPYK
jgi:branched-chain amino acid transport system substrate-binding protein